MPENSPEKHLTTASKDPVSQGPPESKATETARSEQKRDQNRRGVEFVAPSTEMIAPGASPRRLAANRSNSQKSTGPKTTVGKTMSSWNSLRHGLLSKRLFQTKLQKEEDFSHLLTSLENDLEPVGALEHVLVEKIAFEYWRLGLAAAFETLEIEDHDKFHKSYLDKLLKYQTTINRQLFQAINQLERLQRLRRGEDVPAPLNVQVSHDNPSILEEENSEQ